MVVCRFIALAGILGAAPMSGQAASLVEEATFNDWMGMIRQTELPDTSVLNEYVAQTFSGSTPRASLQVSFSPRFSCQPVISVMFEEVAFLPEGSDAIPIIFEVDSEPQDFPVLQDEDDSGRRYSYAAGSSAQRALRQLLDISNRVAVTWGLESTQTTSGNDALSVGFSLIGSQRSTQKMENLCLNHEPIPFDG